MSIFKHLREARAGDRLDIPASTYNAILRMMREFDAVKARLNAGSPVLHRRYDLIRVTNLSEEDIPQFGVVGPDDILFTPTDNIDQFRNRPIFEALAPTVLDHFGKFFIAVEPIADGKVGWCLTGGTCPVIIDVVDEGVMWADVKDGDVGMLTTDVNGTAQILYVESGTGEKAAIVRFGAMNLRPPIFVRITGSTLIGGANYRWRYGGYEVELDGDTFQEKTGGIVFDEDGEVYLLNTVEAFNTATHVAPSIDLEEGYPEGYAPQPLDKAADGTAINAVVHAWQIRNVAGGTQWLCQLANGHGGTCEAP